MATVEAAKTVVGVFDTLQAAEDLVVKLEQAGIPRNDISVVANRDVSGTDATAASDKSTASRGSTVAGNAGVGAALGGVGGLLLSFAALAVPGVGPVLAVGPIVGALSGAGIGAVAGGIIGALTESGIPEEEAHYYAEGIRRGHVLVIVRASGAEAELAREVMDAQGAVDVEGRVKSWRERGWSSYNPGAEPLSADEIRREREYYVAAGRQGDEWALTEREQRDADPALRDTEWPHGEARDVEQSLPKPGPANPAVDPARSASAISEEAEGEPLDPVYLDEGSSSRPLLSDFDAQSNFGDAIENNRRRTDPAVVRAERGFERAMESSVRSARRLVAARIYNRKKTQS